MSTQVEGTDGAAGGGPGITSVASVQTGGVDVEQLSVMLRSNWAQMYEDVPTRHTGM